MSLAGWLEGLRKMRAALPAFNERMSRVIPSTAIEEVNNRIVETGTDSKGQPLKHARSGKEYSDREIPTSVFVDNGMLTAQQAKTLPILTTYVEAKKVIGRYRGKRDLMLTGRMWGNTGLVENKSTATSFHAVVAGRNAETQAKLDNNSALSGVDILAMSKTEEENLAKDFDTELQLFTDQYLK